MDVAAGVFAVISLTVQLVETSQKLIGFLESVSDAPREVQKLIRQLKQMQHSLDAPAPLATILSSLEACQSNLYETQKFVSHIKGQLASERRFIRSWTPLRYVLQKEKVTGLRSQLRDATMDLHLAMSTNSWQLQMHQMRTWTPIAMQLATRGTPQNLILAGHPALLESTKDEHTRDSHESNTSGYIESRKVFQSYYSGVWGEVFVQAKSAFLIKHPNGRNRGKSAIGEEKIVTFVPSFLPRGFDICFSSSMGWIPRSLSMYPVLDFRAPIFRMCQHGDVEGVQRAFSNGDVSPFVLDQHGMTLLHHAASSFNTGLCSMLLQLGIDANRSCAFKEKALQCVGQLSDKYAHGISVRPWNNLIVDTLRIIASAQDEISFEDIALFFRNYYGTPEGARLILDHATDYFDSFSSGQEQGLFPPLAAALRSYLHDPQWETVIWFMIRKGVDLHEPVMRIMCAWEWQPSKARPKSRWGTPLDELFLYTKSPFDGQVAADGWLGILASEGVDVVGYLQKEISIHDPDSQLTFPSKRFIWYENPRQLYFTLGKSPSVHWDWLLDPLSPTCLLREEFKHISLISDDYGLYLDTWEQNWPFTYPAWVEGYRRYPHEGSVYDEWKRLNMRAISRAQRRTRQKELKRSGLKKRPIPGAWVN